MADEIKVTITSNKKNKYSTLVRSLITATNTAADLGEQAMYESLMNWLGEAEQERLNICANMFNDNPARG